MHDGPGVEQYVEAHAGVEAPHAHHDEGIRGQAELGSGGVAIARVEPLEVDARGHHLHPARVDAVALDQEATKGGREHDHDLGPAIDGPLHGPLDHHRHPSLASPYGALLGPRALEVHDEGEAAQGSSSDRE